MVDEQSFAANLMPPLRALIECDAVGYNDVDPSIGAASWLADPVEAGEAGDIEAFERTMHQHPVIESFSCATPSTVDSRSASSRAPDPVNEAVCS